MRLKVLNEKKDYREEESEAKLSKFRSGLEAASAALSTDSGAELIKTWSPEDAKERMRMNAFNCKSILEESKKVAEEISDEQFPNKKDVLKEINGAMQALDSYLMDGRQPLSAADVASNQKVTEATNYLSEALKSMDPKE
ncbi:MAG: hypothetical protein KGH59_03950 [Candidatus Micrarchaeota archaeon]|nr:hypothetical protein [Candidatus Micrarchaeota archaeon]